MRTISYAIACIVLPALWGLAAAWIYDRIAARRARHMPDEDDSADMYHI
jgi:hypothetical protein